MNIRRFRVIIIFLSLFANFSLANDSLLVKIGSSGISVDEFQQRFSLLPQVSDGIKKDLEQKKDNLLYSLIAEKLWAEEAENLNLDTTYIMKYTFKALEKMYVRDALYNIEVTDKVKVTEADKIDALDKIYTALDLDVIQLDDSIKAEKVFSLILNGVPQDSSIVSDISNHSVVQVHFGELKEPVEDLIYSLSEGDISRPIESSSGWLIFRVIKKDPIFYDKPQQALSEAEEIIKQRKVEKYSSEFFKKFFSDQKVEVDEKLFWILSNKITEIFKEKKISNSIPDSESVYLDGNDLLRMKSNFVYDWLSMPFIKFSENPITFRQFLHEFTFEGFNSTSVEEKAISTKLNFRVKTFIEHELLAREGYRRGLQNLADVKSSIEMWKDNYLAQILKNKLLDSVNVSDEEVREEFLNRNKNSNISVPEVNVLEILSDSLELMESILNDLEGGDDFRKLASLYTKRTWTKNNGGEFGYFPVTMYGEIGRIAATMKIGEIYGPIKLLEGYSLFKLIDRRESSMNTSLSFEESKEELRKNLTFKKLSEFFIDYTVRLANKYGVNINQQLFNSVKVADLNMLVYRYFGFGGRITAAPMVLPFIEWFLPWKESKKVVP